MSALLIAFGLVAGIVGLACNQADNPTIRKFLEEQRLRLLAGKLNARRALTLPEAEDGFVLARRHGDRSLTTRFAKVVTSIKAVNTRRHP